MFKRTLTFVFIIVMLLAFAGVQAQDAIEYGQSVSAEMTASDYEFRYTFSGNAGDVVIIRMDPVDIFGDLDNPVLLLLGEAGLIVDTNDSFSFGDALLAAELSAGGEYTVVATREDGIAGDSVGEFTVEMVLAEELTADKALSGTATSDERPQYYIVNSSDAFGVRYEKKGGDLATQINVNTLDADSGGLNEIAVMSGSDLEVGLLGIFDSGSVYIVTVGEAPFDFNFDTVTADFELSLVIAE